MAGQIAVEMTGDEAKLWRSFQKIVDQQKKMEDGFEKVGHKGKKAGKEADGAFGDQAVNKLARYAAGVVSVSAALGGASKILSDIREAANQAGQRITDAASGRRALAQIARTPEELKQLIGKAESLRGGGMVAEAAYKTAFQAGSAGEWALRDAGMFGRLREIGMSPEAAVTGAGKIRAAFGGESGAGTPRQIMNKIIAAAGPSQVMADEIAQAMATSAASFAMAGGQDEELLGMLGVLAEPFKSPLAASEKIKTLADQLTKKKSQIADKAAQEMPLLDLIDALPGLGESGKLRSESGKRLDVNKFLAETNAMQALYEYQLLRPQIQQRISDVRAAQAAPEASDILSGRFAMVASEPMLSSVTAREKAAQSVMMAEEQGLGRYSLLADTLVDEQLSRLRAGGASEGRLSFQRRALGYNRKLIGDEAFLERSLADPSAGPGLSTELAQQIAAALPQASLEQIQLQNSISGTSNEAVARALADAARDMKEAASRINAASGGPSLGKPGSDR